MKKILFIITKSEMGGAQRFLYELATRLNRQKYEILTAAGNPENDKNRGELLKKLGSKGIKTAVIKNFSNTLGIKNFLAFWEILKLLFRFRPDILYLLSSESGFTGSLAGKIYGFFKRKRIKIIYRIGGWAFKEPKNIFIKKIYLWFEKISSPFKDRIIVNSEFDRRLAIKNKIANPMKLVNIYNGLDYENMEFLEKNRARKFLNIPPERFVIGTIANFYENKGLEYLIEAAKKLEEKRDWLFAIIGGGSARPRLEKLIIKNNLENRVVLPGQIPDAYRFIKAFDIFALPSVKEGQPWVILEAMAAEVPIVATNIAGIPEMIENGKSGLLVEPADFPALAEAMEKMAASPSLAKGCAENALKTLKEKFGVKEMVEENEELF